MDILTSAEGPYIQAAEAMVLSFLTNNPGPHNVYVISREAESFRDLSLLCDLAGARFNLLNPGVHIRGMRGPSHAVKRGRKRATYHRIYAGLLLPPRMSKILYLDADVLVRTSVAE